jgi:hypothetical protein
MRHLVTSRAIMGFSATHNTRLGGMTHVECSTRPGNNMGDTARLLHLSSTVRPPTPITAEQHGRQRVHDAQDEELS